MPSFTTEPCSQPHYYPLLHSCGPLAEIEYYSASRTSFDAVLHLSDDGALERFRAAGFSTRKLDRIGLDEMRTLLNISLSVFAGSWGFTPLSESEFLELYSADKLSAHLGALYVLYAGEEIVGFCGTVREDASTMICKTICILPQYQGLKLGNALAYVVHRDAQAAGYTRMIYALIREGNAIQRFPADDVVVFRRYAAFEFTV